MNLDFSNPIVLILGAVFLLALLYFWNKRNKTQLRKRKERNFRKSYYERKKERAKERENDI